MLLILSYTVEAEDRIFYLKFRDTLKVPEEQQTANEESEEQELKIRIEVCCLGSFFKPKKVRK